MVIIYRMRFFFIFTLTFHNINISRKEGKIEIVPHEIVSRYFGKVFTSKLYPHDAPLLNICYICYIICSRRYRVRRIMLKK